MQPPVQSEEEEEQAKVQQEEDDNDNDDNEEEETLESPSSASSEELSEQEVEESQLEYKLELEEATPPIAEQSQEPNLADNMKVQHRKASHEVVLQENDPSEQKQENEVELEVCEQSDNPEEYSSDEWQETQAKQPTTGSHISLPVVQPKLPCFEWYNQAAIRS